MSNVRQLHAPKIGDRTFMLCGCNPNDPQPFVPLVILQQHPVIVGLQCGACDTHLTVSGGVIQEPMPNG
jgi:hypothetical protein